jgi:hypothetical protein
MQTYSYVNLHKKNKKLTPKAHQWPNFDHCCFGHVAVIRCDMIFWEFYGK